MPSVASRPPSFSALSPRRTRSSSTALSTSPPVSSSAFLQSIIPAPVRSRSSLTCLAVIVGVLTSVLFLGLGLSSAGALRRRLRAARGGCGLLGRAPPGRCAARLGRRSSAAWRGLRRGAASRSRGLGRGLRRGRGGLGRPARLGRRSSAAAASLGGARARLGRRRRAWRACARAAGAPAAARRRLPARLAGRRPALRRAGSCGTRSPTSGRCGLRLRAALPAAAAGSSAACAAAPASAARGPRRRGGRGPAPRRRRSASSRGAARRLRALALRLGLLARLLLGLAARALLGLAARLLLGLLAGALLLGAEGPAALGDHVADRLRDRRAGADRVVVAGDDVVDAVRVAVRVDQADDRDAQALGLAHRDRLGLEVDDEHRVGHALHVLDAAEVGLQLLEVGLGRHAARASAAAPSWPSAS